MWYYIIGGMAIALAWMVIAMACVKAADRKPLCSTCDQAGKWVCPEHGRAL